MAKKTSTNPEQNRLFQAFPHGSEDGPIIYRDSQADLRHPEAKISNHNMRIRLIKDAAKGAIAYNKGKRMGLEDWAILQRGYEPVEIRRNMKSNWQSLVENLGNAALVCERYNDGTCAINCNPEKWYAKYAKAKDAHKIASDIENPTTIC